MSDELFANYAGISIKIGGQAREDLEDDLDEVLVETTYNLPGMVTIRLHDPRLEWAADETIKPGAPLAIELAPPGVYPKDGDEAAKKYVLVFKGEIVSIEPEFSAHGMHNFVIRAYDCSYRLHYGRWSQTYLDMNDAAIVKEVAGLVGLKCSADNPGTTHEYVLQINQTPMEFLAERARRIGYQLFVLEDTVYFKKPDYIVAGPTLELSEELRSFQLRATIAHQASQFGVYGWDVATKKEIIGKATAVATKWQMNGLNKVGGTFTDAALGLTKKPALVRVDQAVVDKSEADKIAEGMASESESHFIEADGVCKGNPLVQAGKQIEITGVGTRFTGKYFVSSATHVYREGDYMTHFTVTGRHPRTMSHLLQQENSPREARGRIDGVVVGVVTNNTDEKNYGRVKVKFPWLPPDTKGAPIDSHWARMASPFAGDNRGFFYLPEINDEVLVAFEQGDVNRPYIVGMLWNGKDLPPEKHAVAVKAGKVVQRILKSRLGHRIVLDDSDDKTSILIEDKTTKQSILIDSTKNSITVKAGGDMLIDITGNITIKAGQSIDIEAAQDITMKATNVTVTANAQGKINANMLELKGTATALMDSSATQVTGDTVMIQGTGPVDVQGNPIMLN